MKIAIAGGGAAAETLDTAPGISACSNGDS